ncbi:MAG: guanylate kinase [Dehalococcoidales bacterium]|jgi:guanylate kinase
MSSDSSLPLCPPARPLLIVLSGLSGAGKDSVLNGLKKSSYPLEFIVTVTTRPRRRDEKDGIHYNFVSPARFQEMIDSRQMLEWANVYGNWYGAPIVPVKKALESGKDVIIKVDVQGAATYKKIVPQAVFIFLAVPSIEECAPRLKQRSTESQADLELRLKTAREELEKLHLFDYLVINRHGELDRAVADIEAIIAAEKCRVTPREIKL